MAWHLPLSSTGAEGPAAGPSCHPHHPLPPRRPPANPEVQSQCPGHSFNPWGRGVDAAPLPPRKWGRPACVASWGQSDSVAHLTATDFYLFFTCIYLFLFGIRLCSAPLASSPLLTSCFLSPSRSAPGCAGGGGAGTSCLRLCFLGSPGQDSTRMLTPRRVSLGRAPRAPSSCVQPHTRGLKYTMSQVLRTAPKPAH